MLLLETQNDLLVSGDFELVQDVSILSDSAICDFCYFEQVERQSIFIRRQGRSTRPNRR